MSNKIKRKVTVENSKDGDDHPRRPSVFERLGSNVNVASQPQERHTRPEPIEKCRNWLRHKSCAYGTNCRYKHDSFSPPRAAPKTEKNMDDKDLRHRVRPKRDEPKGSRTGSLSPKRVGKRNSSRSRKGEHESKIKSTVVVTRPRSPAPPPVTEPTETKKKSEGNWEDDSDDWPMDAAQLDFKEELTLERKRQQLQRELALELQKERLLNENVTITKTVSFSESSSTSSSSDSGSISSSSGSTSSSSDDDTDSSSSSSSSSSSGSRPNSKKKNKKSKDGAEKSDKLKNDYDKIKSSRGKTQKMRSPSPGDRIIKKGKDKIKDLSQSPKRRLTDSRNMGDSRSNLHMRGPRTPSPVASRKNRQWAQSSSTDSRSADVQRSKGKRHKKKRDGSRSDKYKRGSPPLSSPNRTSKKLKQRDENRGKLRHGGRDSSPLLPRNAASNSSAVKLIADSPHYLSDEKFIDKRDDRSKFYSRKDDDILSAKRTDSRERGGKRNRISPKKDIRRGSVSPIKDRYDSDVMSGAKKLYHKDKLDRRQGSDSPRSDRRKILTDIDKKRDVRELSPRHDRRDNQYRSGEALYDKRGDAKGKRLLSPDIKKGRDGRDYSQKDRNNEYDTSPWAADHRKTSSTGRRTPEPRGRQDIRVPPSDSQVSRDRDQDRKKRKDRPEDSDRARLSPRRSPSPIHGHHGIREIEPLTGNRGHIYDADIPPAERDYAYGYDPLHEPYLSDRLLPPDYEAEVIRGPPLYPPDVYPDSRYRRNGKDPAPLIDRYGPRDVISPREVLPHRDIISLTGRTDDYLPDIPIEERGYDERWPRNRGRDDWDDYATVPPAPLPPHVAAAMDEDRYGMPRRRRASPDWQRGRIDDRDSSIGGHRPLGRGQPRDGRSRSPPKGPGGNRTWGDRGGRHDNRLDNRHEDSQKGMDDRKGSRYSRKDRGKRKDDPPDVKIPLLPKPTKRPHSVSPPPKDLKRRREDATTPDSIHLSDKGSYKRSKDDKNDKPSRIQKSTVKADASKLSEGRNRDREERRGKHDAVRGDDDFSDWSDGDDDLLNRDDFIDSEGTNDNSRMRSKVDDKMLDENSQASRRQEKMKDHPSIKKIKGNNSRTSSRERIGNKLLSALHALTGKPKPSTQSSLDRNKDNNLPEDKLKAKDHPALKKVKGNSRTSSRERAADDHSTKNGKTENKESDVPETLSVKEDTATDVEEYITAESVDYDPISDDELDALIEEPEESSLLKPTTENEKSKIVDALEVDWSALMKETKTEFKPGFARRRFKTAHVLQRIGFSQVFAGAQLSQKIIDFCQKELTEEKDENEENSEQSEKKEEKKFVMEHQIAAFHVAISQAKKERINSFNQVGPFRRAFCARRDLQLRTLLCKPINKFAPTSPATAYSPQYSLVDKDLYKQSLELLKQKTHLDTRLPIANVC